MKEEDWISVEEYLPGSKVRKCLFLFDDRQVESYDALKFNIKSAFTYRDESSGAERKRWVTHWMPTVLPERTKI